MINMFVYSIIMFAIITISTNSHADNMAPHSISIYSSANSNKRNYNKDTFNSSVNPVVFNIASSNCSYAHNSSNSYNAVSGFKSSNGLLSKQPPPGFVYLTFAIAIVSLLSNLIGFVIKRFDRLIDRIYVLKQEYWTKTFLVPVCLEPLREFILENTSELNILNTKTNGQPLSMRKIAYSGYEMDFRRGKDKLINQFMILNSFNAEVYCKISMNIDELEDIITKHCYANSHDIDSTHEYYPLKYADLVVKNMFSTLSLILMIISENHDNLFLNKRSIKLFLKDQIKRFQI